jgi:hypothetical protein
MFSLVTDYTNGRVVDESARRGEATGLLDFIPVDKADRRDGIRADASHFHALRDERAGYENRHLLLLLLTFGSMLDRGVGEHGSGKHAGRDERYNA